MLRQAIVLLLFFPQLIFSQGDLPFQVLVADKATIAGKDVEPLTYVDDVTSIDIVDGGFVALVHKEGTTFELKKRTFTFYLKPNKGIKLVKRPDLNSLYSEVPASDDVEQIVVLHPLFDNSRLVKWPLETPINIFWHLPDEPVISYKLSVFNHEGKKVQDFGTTKHNFEIKPYHLGLTGNSFNFQIFSTFAGETVESESYTVQMVEMDSYPAKSSDLVMKAMALDVSPVSALEVWKEVLGTENGRFYSELFEKFITRNRDFLINSGEDVEQLLSQNK